MKLFDRILGSYFSWRNHMTFNIVYPNKGKKIYHFSLIVLFFGMLISLGLYFFIGDNMIGNLFGNTFAGCLTGIIVGVLNNLKSREIKYYQSLLNEYNYLHNTFVQLNKKIDIFLSNPDKDFSMISVIYTEIDNSLNELPFRFDKELENIENINIIIKKVKSRINISLIDTRKKDYLDELKEVRDFLGKVEKVLYERVDRIRLDKSIFEEELL